MGNQQSRLTPEQVADIQRQTAFDKKEIMQWYRGFLKDYPAGHMERADFLKLYKQFFPFGDPAPFASYVFNVFDSNRDGIVNFQEFMIALSVTGRGKLQDKHDFAFQLYDIDRDGFITREEMLKIVEALYRMVGAMVKPPPDEDTPEKRVDKIFLSMKKAPDAKLSKQDFVEMTRKDPTLMQGLCLYDGLV